MQKYITIFALSTNPLLLLRAKAKAHAAVEAELHTIEDILSETAEVGLMPQWQIAVALVENLIVDTLKSHLHECSPDILFITVHNVAISAVVPALYNRQCPC